MGSERIEAVRARYAALRALGGPDSQPGQSGSLLDYQEDAEVGAILCEEAGEHTFTTGNDVWQFCSRCGRRVRRSTGESSSLLLTAVLWEQEDRS